MPQSPAVDGEDISSHRLSTTEMATAAVATQARQAATSLGEGGHPVPMHTAGAPKGSEEYPNSEPIQQQRNTMFEESAASAACAVAPVLPAAGSAPFTQLPPPSNALAPASHAAAVSAPSTPPNPAAAHPLPAPHPAPQHLSPSRLQNSSTATPPPVDTPPNSKSHTPPTPLLAAAASPPLSLPHPIPISAPCPLASSPTTHLMDTAGAEAGIFGADNYQGNVIEGSTSFTAVSRQPTQGLQPAATSPPSMPDSLPTHLKLPHTPGSVSLGMGGAGQVDADGVQICFDFTKGACTRGSLCRYSHDVATIVQFNSREKGVCFDFLRNQCQRGLLCRFSHDVSNMAQQQQQPTFTAGAKNRSTAICYDFVKGACIRGENCTFSHDLAMIARKAPRARAARANEVCYDFLRGRCVRGMNCRFSHQVAYDPVTGFPITPMATPAMPMQPPPNAIGYSAQASPYNCYMGLHPDMPPPAPQQQQQLPPGMLPHQPSQEAHLSSLQGLAHHQQPAMLPSGTGAPQLQADPTIAPNTQQQSFLSPPSHYSTSAISFQAPLESPKGQIQPLSAGVTPTTADVPTRLAQMLSRQSPLPAISPLDPASPTNHTSLQEAMSSISLQSSATGGTLTPTGGFSSPTYPVAQRPHPFSTSNIPTTHNPTRLMHQTGPNDFPLSPGGYLTSSGPNPSTLRPLRTSLAAFSTGNSYTPTPTSSRANPLVDPGFASGAVTPSSPHVNPTFSTVAPSISTAQSILIAMHRQQQQAAHQSYTSSIPSLGASLGNTPEMANPTLGTSLQPSQSGCSNPPPSSTSSATFPHAHAAQLEPQLASQSWGARELTPSHGVAVGWQPLEQARNMWSTTAQADDAVSPQ